MKYLIGFGEGRILYPYILAVILILPVLTFAGNQKDSLRSVLFSESLDSGARIQAAYQLYEFYMRTDPDSCMLIAELIEDLDENKEDTVIADIHNIKGLAYYFKGEYKMARDEFDTLLSLEGKLQRSDRIASAHTNLSNVYNLLGDFEKSLSHAVSSLEILREGNDKVQIAMSLYAIGNTYRRIKEPGKGLNYFLEALEIVTAEKDSRGMAACHSNVGNCYQSLKEFDKSLFHFQQSLIYYREIGAEASIATCYNNIGLLYLAKKEYPEALEQFKKSQTMRLKLKDRNGLLNSNMNLSKVLSDMGKYEEAEKYGIRALEMSKEMNNPMVSIQMKRVLYEINQRQGKLRPALEHIISYMSLKDSVMNVEKLNQMNEMEARFQNEKKQLEIENLKQNEQLQEEEIRRQYTQKVAFAGGFGFMLLLAFIIFRGYKRKQRDNELITRQKREVEIQRDLIEEKSREITDSINYARRIQAAILPPDRLVKEYLANSFILYKPKDIVAGDFYWMEQKEDKILFAAADCTGHGVPGAMVSVICNNGLNRSVREHSLTDPARILEKTREIVIREFEKSEEEVMDGMDIALCSINYNTSPVRVLKATLQYAGANNPLYHIRNGELSEIKGDKQPIGKYGEPKPFTTHTLELQEGDSIYIFSDGFADQFGGPKGKKFKSKAFKELLLSIQDHPMLDQRQMLEQSFEQWRGDMEQIDDVCIIGVRV